MSKIQNALTEDEDCMLRAVRACSERTLLGFRLQDRRGASRGEGRAD